MSQRFNPTDRLIIVPVEVEGPSGSAVYRLALDTGATGTLINTALLVALGYDPTLAPSTSKVTTASGVEHASCLPVKKITTLGQERIDFPVVALTLPLSTTIDGLLGLDFLRGQVLTIDFRAGEITLS